MAPKVDVLTHHWVPNFGANLQAFATSQFLTGLGAQVRFCDFRPVEMEELYRESVSEKQRAAHEAFLEAHLSQTRRIRTMEDFANLVKEEPADVYVSGSDAVFRLKPKTRRADWVFPNPYWLVGINDIRSGRKSRKFALAASAMGCRFTHLSAAEKAQLCAAVNDMNAVSVRDEWTRNQLSKVGISREIAIVPDPVISLSNLIVELAAKGQSRPPYIIVSTGGTLSEKWVESFSSICEKNGFETVGLPLPEGTSDLPVSRSLSTPIGPLNWLEELAGSRGYVGVRFHPVLCAIIAGVPVVALDRYHRNFLDSRRSKTYEIMKLLGLQDACFGRWQVSRLSPEKAFHLMERQVVRDSERREKLVGMRTVFQKFITNCLDSVH